MDWKRSTFSNPKNFAPALPVTCADNYPSTLDEHHGLLESSTLPHFYLNISVQVTYAGKFSPLPVQEVVEVGCASVVRGSAQSGAGERKL